MRAISSITLIGLLIPLLRLIIPVVYFKGTYEIMIQHPPLLVLDHFCCIRSEEPLFTPLSLSLHAGESVHLQAANGIGKTTLLRAIYGLAVETLGDIYWRGTVMSHGLAHHASYINDRNGVVPYLSTLEALDKMALLTGQMVSKKILRDTLDHVGLHRPDDPCDTLSKGQKKRLHIARLLLAKRTLWLLDEPFDGLDADGSQILLTAMNQHLDQQGIILYTSHLQHQARADTPGQQVQLPRNAIIVTIRIHSGRWRGTQLDVAHQPGLRPTPSRLRETLANWLRHRQPFDTILDLFAGSGALGLEICSQSPSRVTFVDNNKQLTSSLTQVMDKLQFAEATVHTGDARQFLRTSHEVFDLVLLDPPYALDWYEQVLVLLETSGIMADRAYIYCEYEHTRHIAVPETWQQLKETRVGQVSAGLWQRTDINE